MQRSRLLQLFMAVLSICVGLYLRSNPTDFPEILVKYGGIALWAMLVFFLAGFIWNRAKTDTLSTWTLIFCYAVEVSQDYHFQWLDDFRNTFVGHVLLGSTFNWLDLVAYTAGIFLGSIIERFFITNPSDLSRLR